MRIIEKKFRHDRISDFSELIFCGIPFFYYNPEKIKLFSFTFEKNSAIYRFIEKADNFFYYKPGRTWCAQWLAAGKADKTTFEKDHILSYQFSSEGKNFSYPEISSKDY